jgi:hypothetical protein
MDLGTVVYDTWTRCNGVVVAGAQMSGYVTVHFAGLGEVVTVHESDLII